MKDFLFSIKNKYVRCLVACAILAVVVLLAVFEAYIPLQKLGFSYFETTFFLFMFILAIDRVRLFIKDAEREQSYKNLIVKKRSALAMKTTAE
ncbi:MAG: hypothetical protein PVI21_03070 [Candidatus Woesebacteria bacterium]|jgi:hypothetical protein